MKSPVAYGAGNAKLRGKKIKVMRCGCCVAFDFRGKCKEELAKKEIRDYNPLQSVSSEEERLPYKQ